MSDPAFKPVFIDQMPDYQEAVKKASALANHREAFAAAAKELGLAAELQQTKDGLLVLNGREQVLEANEQRLELQHAQIDADQARASHRIHEANTIVSTSTGVVAGLTVARKAKSWKLLKTFGGTATGALTAMLAVFGIGNLIQNAGYERKKDNEKAQALNQIDEAQVGYQAKGLQSSFIDKMANRMLEQQKMLTGEGAEMKLVSTAVPQTLETTQVTPSMAEKYASAPAASKAAAIAEQRTEFANAQVR